jgi:hypothetical protein
MDREIHPGDVFEIDPNSPRCPCGMYAEIDPIPRTRRSKYCRAWNGSWRQWCGMDDMAARCRCGCSSPRSTGRCTAGRGRL